jgi:hypothetical protein
MALTKITQEDTNNKGVIGLPDTPNLTTQAMQEKFDELALDVIVPKHNGLIDELEAETAAASLGAVDTLGEATTIQAMLNRQAESGYTKAETDALLSNKVDTEVGKGLSTYDFSEAYKTKLNNIEDNANNYVLPKGTQSELGGVMGDGSTFTIDENGVGHAVGGGGGGTADYEALINKPKLNDKALIGDKQSEEYGILRPYIKVTSDAGSTVTITKGTETITLTQVSGSSTEWEGHPTSYGTWTVKSVLAGADDATTTVTVDAVKTYAVTVSHISATITVTYPVGSTYCKLSKGALEYTATQNPQTFTVRSIGTWNIEVEYNGVVKTATAIISADGDSQSVAVEYATITVNYGNDFKGKTITCTDGNLTYTKTAPSDASTVSFTIPTTGTWAVSATVGGTPYSVSQVVSAYTTYTVTLEVFSATVTITFPYSNGATCTVSDGDTTLTATESPMAFTIPNTGTWVATCTLDGQSKTQSFVITTDGQTESHTFEYGTINLTFDNEFRGLTVTCANGGTVISKTAPISGNTMAFYPPSTGEWIISATYSGTPYSTSATVVSLSTAVSAILQTLPNGQTVLPTDDIQTWLKCAGINNKTSYTTLADVLGDSTTLLALMSHNNAVDYLVRSTSWTTASGLVPTMTSDTTPSGECFASSGTAYSAFNGDTSNWWECNSYPAYIGYDFKYPVRICKMTYTIRSGRETRSPKDFVVEGFNGVSWESVYTGVGTAIGTSTFTFSNTNSYEKYRMYVTTDNGGNELNITTLQFYATAEVAGLCDNSTAMTDIGANDYCANTLLADATWCSAICNSTYFESVLTTKVPTMTSNTTPSGVASASNVASGHQPYLAFDGNNSTYAAITNAVAEYFQYQFTTTVKAFILDYLSPDENVSEWKVQGSNDNSTYTDIPNSAFTMSTTMSRVVMNNDTAYQYYRITVTKKHPSYNGLGAYTLQLYGR